MSTSFIIYNSTPADGNFSGNELTATASGVGTYVIMPFRAYESETINKIQLCHRTLTNGNNYTLTVGIGTMDSNTGTGYTSAVNTLAFISSSTATGFTSNSQPIFTIPDITTTYGQNYFVGWQITANTGTFVHQAVLQAIPNRMQEADNYNFIQRTTGGPTSIAGTRFSAINWGYDSGNGVTTWYNRTPGHYNFGVITASTTAIKGTTFYLNMDCERVYVDSITVGLRNPSAAFPSGTGATWMITLYDSDGTTALIGHTVSAFSAFNTFGHKNVLPVKYWLDNKKLYHFAFAGIFNANTLIATLSMPSSWQSGLAYTSVYFTKTSGSASPVYDPNTVLFHHLHITDIRGNRQGGEGDVTIF